MMGQVKVEKHCMLKELQLGNMNWQTGEHIWTCAAGRGMEYKVDKGSMKL